MLFGCVVFSFSGCGWSTVDPGFVGVKVKRYGDNKGVDPSPYTPGTYMLGFGEDMVCQYPTHRITKAYTASTIEGSDTNEEFKPSTSEGTGVGMDISITYSVNAKKAPYLYSTFTLDPDGLNAGFIRQVIREGLTKVVSTMTVDQICGEKKSEMMTLVNKYVVERLTPYGFENVDLCLMNNPRPPQNVIDNINAKIAMNQRAATSENQIRDEKAKAEIKKIQADALAYYNRTVAASMNQTLVNYTIAQKWNGNNPIQIGGQPIVDLRK